MRKFGLIGKTLGHSFSPQYFTNKFEKENIVATYDAFELASIDQFETLIRQHDFAGLNVTIPYKTAVIPYLDELDDTAAAIQAVNTIAFENGKLKGYNTDIIGFKNSIKPFLEHGQERALILGTGGASKAVAYVLQQLGITVFYLSRTPQAENEFAYADCNDNMINSCKIIVNTTPLGTFPKVDQKPDIPYTSITENHLCYDLIYNPEQTQFLKLAKAQGATVVNGWSMLKIQAEAAWGIWEK